MLAPEEIRRGDYVAVMHVVSEFSPLWWCDEASPSPEPIRMRFVPDGGALPLKVKAVCLPYVLAVHPTGDPLTLDVRQHRLARLDNGFARESWKTYRRQWKRGRGRPQHAAFTDASST